MEQNHCNAAPLQHISAWTILSPLGTADVRRREGKDPSYLDLIWLCDLCPAHFNKHVLRADAIDHVSTVCVEFIHLFIQNFLNHLLDMMWRAQLKVCITSTTRAGTARLATPYSCRANHMLRSIAATVVPWNFLMSLNCYLCVLSQPTWQPSASPIVVHMFLMVMHFFPQTWPYPHTGGLD